MDRLALDAGRIAAIARQVRDIVALPDPVGEVVDGFRLANGLDVRKVRVPLGVIAVVYEARPNVTIDAAALCLKSGNAVVLRGSSMAAHSNAVLAAVAIEAGLAAGLPEGAMSLVAGGGHEELEQLATQSGVVDLIIPRGGEGLKAALKGVATVPVLYAASGNCHVYVDETASLDDALAIVMNAKIQRPSVCNAAETLLVHEAIAAEFLPAALGALAGGRGRACASTTGRGRPPPAVSRSRGATEEDWATEYHALTLAVGGRRLDRGGDRAHQPLRLRSLGGDRHPGHRVGARVPARRGRRVRVRQRVHPVHRRRRVRDGRGDRQLDPEAPRARPDRRARAVLVQVPDRGFRPRSSVSGSGRPRAELRSARA